MKLINKTRQAYRIKQINKNNQIEFNLQISDWREVWRDAEYELIGEMEIVHNTRGELIAIQEMKIEDNLTRYALGFYSCKNCKAVYLLPLDHNAIWCECGKDIY